MKDAEQILQSPQWRDLLNNYRNANFPKELQAAREAADQFVLNLVRQICEQEADRSAARILATRSPK